MGLLDPDLQRLFQLHVPFGEWQFIRTNHQQSWSPQIDGFSKGIPPKWPTFWVRIYNELPRFGGDGAFDHQPSSTFPQNLTSNTENVDSVTMRGTMYFPSDMLVIKCLMTRWSKRQAIHWRFGWPRFDPQI